MILTYKNADNKVEQLKQQGHDVYWEGYTVVSFRPNPSAMYNQHGVYRNGSFGYEKRFEVTPEGTWQLYGFNKRKK